MPIPLLAAVPGTGIGLAVTLGDLPFNQGPDENGCEYYLSSIDGWDSPSLREDLDDRPLAHGAFRGTSFYGAREIGLSGVVLSPGSLPALRLAKDRLAYATDLTDADAVLLVDEAPAKQCHVRRSGRLRLAQTGEHLLRWELDLTAADPRKYAAAERTLTLRDGQSVTAPNAGTFRAGAPVLLAFDAAGTVEIGPETVTVTGPAVVDTLEGTVLDQGVSVYSRLRSRGPLPALPAQAATPVRYFGSGSVRLTWRDAWI